MPKSEIGAIWRWSFIPSEFKVWIDPKYQSIRAQIAGWKESVKDATYFYPNNAITWDYIIPAKLYNRAAELLGLPKREIERSEKQIEQIQRLIKSGENTRFSGQGAFKFVTGGA